MAIKIVTSRNANNKVVIIEQVYNAKKKQVVTFLRNFEASSPSIIATVIYLSIESYRDWKTYTNAVVHATLTRCLSSPTVVINA